MQVAQPAPQRDAHLCIERTEGLVEQQQVRLDRQRPRQRHALALATAQLRGVACTQAIQLHALEQLIHAFGDLRAAGPARARAHAQAEGDVFRDSHVTEQGVVLEHQPDAALACRYARQVATVLQQRSRVGSVQSGQDAQQRGLARAGRTEQGDELALAQRQAHVVQRGEFVEAAREVGDFDGHWVGV